MVATPTISTTTTSPVIPHEVAKKQKNGGQASNTNSINADDHVTDGDRELQHSEEPSSTSTLSP